MLIFIPILGSIPTYLLGRVSSVSAKGSAVGISSLILVLSVYAYSEMLKADGGARYNFVEGPVGWVRGFGLYYYLGMDGLAGPLVLISAILVLLAILGSWNTIQERVGLYYALMMLFEGSIIGVFTSLNLIVFYVFWDIVLVPMFFFIGIWGGPRRRYAAMKFVIFTYVGGTIMLLGFIAIYAMTDVKTFNIPDLVGKIPLELQLLVSAATFIGFGVKLPLVPFHTWLPDAHVEAPAPVSVLLAGLLLKMGGYGFLRFNLGLFSEASMQYSWIYIAFGLLTMFYGAVAAMVQRDLKRMIALTSINHMGFVVLGAFSGPVAGISGAVFQMFNHAAAIGLLFMLSGFIHEQAGTRDLTELKGLAVTMPKTALLLTLGSLAGIGIPVFASFVSEYMVILSAVTRNTILAVSALVPVITLAYFIQMIRKSVYSNVPAETLKHDMSIFSAVWLGVFIVPLLVTFFMPQTILGLTDAYAKALVQSMRSGL